MSKVYAIIHDGAHVLVGSGGKSGKPPTPRGGYHLPGGTYNPKSGKPLERNPKNAAERELKEETGIRIAASDFKKAFKLKLGEEEVMFVVAKVNSVAALIPQNFQQPPINNQYDEPFTSLIAVAFDSWDTDANFGAAHHTEWFKDGLTHASANDFLT